MPYQFHGQRANEEVVLICKQHPIILLHPALVSGAILLVPLVFYVFLALNTFMSWLFIICFVVAVIHVLMALYAWNNSLLLVTDERVVLQEQRGLFSREFSECGLESIHQMTHEIKGMLHTLFGVGNIMIYTGASQGAFRIANMPDPYELQQEIQRVRSE